MKAKEYLDQVKKLNRLIENKMAEREQWRSMATSTGTFSNGERVQTSGSQQKMADAVCRYMDLEKEIDSCIDRYVDARQDVIATIEQLPAVEYDLLHKIYIQEIELADIPNICGKSYSWVTKVHGWALKAVQDILDRKEKYREEMQNLRKDV